MRAYLGLETTRGWSEKTVLRTAPCLFGLFSVIALLYVQLPPRMRAKPVIVWPGKTDHTFSDAITTVRRWLWSHWVFATPRRRGAFSKLPQETEQIGTLIVTLTCTFDPNTFTFSGTAFASDSGVTISGPLSITRLEPLPDLLLKAMPWLQLLLDD